VNKAFEMLQKEILKATMPLNLKTED